MEKKTYRFIVADDSVRQRNVLIRILRDEGHEVVDVADDGAEAIEKCKKLLPDVVMLDVSMRKVNGDVAAKTLHEDKELPNLFVICVSNMVQGMVSRPLIASGIPFLSKPYTTGQFLNHLREELERYESTAASRTSNNVALICDPSNDEGNSC